MTLAFPTPARAAPDPLHERPRKGKSTRAAIVDAALAIARREGLEGLTIGLLAEALGMSKSGVFAHFGSREDLQLAVLREYAVRFVDEVLRPAIELERGLPRLQAILENWLRLLARELEQGCLMISGASEYDDRPGALRDAMVSIVTGWKQELLRAIEAARSAGHLRRGIESRQLVFEIYGLMLALHHDARLLRTSDSVKRARAGLARLIDSVRARPAERRRVSSDRSASKSRRAGARAARSRSPRSS
jgi:AcrR family transcriptional regulator